jgi:hypothetical protein
VTQGLAACLAYRDLSSHYTHSCSICQTCSLRPRGTSVQRDECCAGTRADLRIATSMTRLLSLLLEEMIRYVPYAVSSHLRLLSPTVRARPRANRLLSALQYSLSTIDSPDETQTWCARRSLRINAQMLHMSKCLRASSSPLSFNISQNGPFL